MLSTIWLEISLTLRKGGKDRGGAKKELRFVEGLSIGEK